MKRLRVCMLIDAWEPIWGGGQRHVWEISKLLVKYFNCEIDIYTRALVSETGKIYTHDETFFNNKLKIIRVGPATKYFNLWARLGWFLTVVFAVFSQHKLHPYQLVHAHSYTPAIPAKFLQLWLGIPVVFTVHAANHLDRQQFGPTALLEKILLTQIRFDKLISVSQHFLTYANINKDIVVIPNGVDTSVFNRVKPKSHSHFRILWVGRFDPVKGVDILLQATAQLVKTATNIKLVLVGYGYDESKYRTLAKNLNIDQNIEWKGKLTGTTLIQEYKHADVFILPSLSEGFPITLLEAWAAKLPVIATDVGDNDLLVKEGVNGYLIKPGDVKQLVHMMSFVRTNSYLLRLGSNGYNLVKEKYTWDSAARKIFNVYSILIP